VPNPARPHPSGTTPAPPPSISTGARTEEAATTHRHRNDMTHPTADQWSAGQPGADRPSSHRHRPRSRRPGASLARRLPTVMILTVGLLLAASAPAYAAAGPTINGVISNLTAWLVGILAGVATLFLTIGGLRYLTAGGDPVQVEKAKTALKSAAIGYALAALAPLIVSILASVVGGS
jgi:hypothetical protein